MNHHHSTPEYFKISETEYHFTHYLAAWKYTQTQSLLHYAIEKISEHLWKLSILSHSGE